MGNNIQIKKFRIKFTHVIKKKRYRIRIATKMSTTTLTHSFNSRGCRSKQRLDSVKSITIVVWRFILTAFGRCSVRIPTGTGYHNWDCGASLTHLSSYHSTPRTYSLYQCFLAVGPRTATGSRQVSVGPNNFYSRKKYINRSFQMKTSWNEMSQLSYTDSVEKYVRLFPIESATGKRRHSYIRRRDEEHGASDVFLNEHFTRFCLSWEAVHKLPDLYGKGS
jgi:hypothetical protein